MVGLDMTYRIGNADTPAELDDEMRLVRLAPFRVFNTGNFFG